MNFVEIFLSKLDTADILQLPRTVQLVYTLFGLRALMPLWFLHLEDWLWRQRRVID
jgi:hypothetical protein